MSNKNFVNFLNINKKLVFEGKKFKIIIFDRQRIIPSILGSIFSIALAQKNKSDILVVTNNQNTNFVKIVLVLQNFIVSFLTILKL